MAKIYTSADQLIGKTPLLELSHIEAEEGLSAKLTNVIAVEIPNKMGSLHSLLTALTDFNIEYMYVLSVGETASMIVKIKDYENAESVISTSGFRVLGQDEIGV